jgi:hypothetical protein
MVMADMKQHKELSKLALTFSKEKSMYYNFMKNF